MSLDSLSIDVSTARNGEITLFTLSGSLDLATSPSLRAALVESAEHGNHDMVVDLRNLEFVDSTGLGALIGAHKRALENGGTVRLVVNEGQILRLLRITGLLAVFAVYPTVEDALHEEQRLAGL